MRVSRSVVTTRIQQLEAFVGAPLFHRKRVVTLYFKQGLWGRAQQRFGLSLFPTQRTLKT